MQYVEPRYTKDLDIWVSADIINAAAVYKSLRAFGAPLVGLTEADFAEEGYFYQMGDPPIRVDILMGIPGLTFSQGWSGRVEVEFDNLIVPFISRTDLIIAKQASGRAQDLIDADLLSQAGEI